MSSTRIPHLVSHSSQNILVVTPGIISHLMTDILPVVKSYYKAVECALTRWHVGSSTLKSTLKTDSHFW